jgi:nucleoid DNA-binding protein
MNTFIKKETNMSDKVKPMSSIQVRQRIADIVGISNQQVKAVLEALAGVAIEQTNTAGLFTVPGICRIAKHHKPARPERKMMSPLTKQEITVKAKPAYSVVKVKPIKALKDAVA